MSLLFLGAIFENGPKESSSRLLLLAIANYADAEGVAWPSVETLARNTASAPRTVMRNLKSLCADGWLVVGPHHDDRRRNRYRILADRLTFKKPRISAGTIAEDNCDSSQMSPIFDKSDSSQMSQMSPNYMTSATELGDIHDSLIRNEPLGNHQETVKATATSAVDEPFQLSSATITIPIDRKSGKRKRAKDTTAADPRFKECVDCIFGCYRAINERDPRWGPADIGQLQLLLRQNPKLSKDEFDYCLINYSASTGQNFAAPPASFLPRLLLFQNGPLDRFGKPLE